MGVVALVMAALASVTASASDDPPARAAAVSAGSGYWLVGSDGSVYQFGNAPFRGSLSGTPVNQPMVGAASTPGGQGYWLVAVDGGVFAFGDAGFHGSTGSIKLNQPIVGMAATRSGRGYWFVASDGGVFAFGDARFFGSMGSKPLNRPVVGMAATPSGNGYWLVASDGGIFAFGDAGFYGSTGSMRLNRPIVGMTTSPTGRGYRFVASDGGIFSFGDARFFGSAGGRTLRAPVVGMAATPSGNGYWLVASDGAVLNFGDAVSSGSLDGRRLPAAITAMAPVPTTGSAPAPAPGGPAPAAGGNGATGSPGSVPDDGAPAPTPAGPAFDMAAVGDTGYTDEDDELFLKARASMNSYPLAFVVHDGDIKDPLSPCTEARLDYVHGVFEKFTAPFIYTPGDNEWSDCPDPARQLADLRRIFFSGDESLGQRRISLTRQEPPFVENARWVESGVVFATINLPGPAGTGAKGIQRAAEAWLNAAFDTAEANGSPGVMIIWQDDPFDGAEEDELMDALEARSKRYGQPVVLVHGDTHVYKLDHPWKDVPNLTRLETYALEDTNKWVKVHVDPADPEVFSFTTVKSR